EDGRGRLRAVGAGRPLALGLALFRGRPGSGRPAREVGWRLPRSFGFRRSRAVGGGPARAADAAADPTDLLRAEAAARPPPRRGRAGGDDPQGPADRRRARPPRRRGAVAAAVRE